MGSGRRRHGIRESRNRLLSQGGSTDVYNDIDSDIETIEMERPPVWGPKTVFDAVTGKSKFVYSLKEEMECLDSGEYVENPSQSGPHNAKDYEMLVNEEMIFAGMEVEVPEEVIEEHRERVNYANELRLKQQRNPAKKYLTQMNVEELIEEGLEYDLDFTNYYDLPVGERRTKLDMVHAIKLAQRDKTGKKLR